MNCKIIYTEKAKYDLTEIALFIAKDNINRAISYTEEIKLSIEKLADYPELGVNPKKYKLPDGKTKAYIIDNYVALYTYDKQSQEIIIKRVVNVALLHGTVRTE